MISKLLRQSTGTLNPHTFIDLSLRHWSTRAISPFSVTWRQLHRTMVWI